MSQPLTGHELEAESTAESAAAWLSVAQASAALNLSEKTVRKRIKTGEIEAVRVALEKGGTAYRVPRRAVYGLGAAIGTEDQTGRNGSGTEDLGRNGTETESVVEPERNFAKIGTEAGKAVSVPILAPSQWEQRETDFRDEIKFLRSLVEQRDRDAAELRAALRKALEVMPKQLTQGAPGAAESNAIEAPTRAAKPPDEPTLGHGAKRPQIARNGPQTAPQQAQRDKRALWRVILGLR